MDTLEAKLTVIALWPTNFRTPQWQQQLVDLLETWDGMERRQVIEALKKTHQGKRVTLETLRQCRASVTGSKQRATDSLYDRERVCREFMDTLGLGEAFAHAQAADRIEIERLVWVMINYPGWERQLERQSGSPRFWEPWERVENLVECATKTEINGRKVTAPTRDRNGHGAAWQPPIGTPPITLPEPRLKMTGPENEAGRAWLLKLIKRHGGMANGASIQADPEYTEYLRDYAQREARARHEQLGEFDRILDTAQ